MAHTHPSPCPDKSTFCISCFCNFFISRAFCSFFWIGGSSAEISEVAIKVEQQVAQQTPLGIATQNITKGCYGTVPGHRD